MLQHCPAVPLKATAGQVPGGGMLDWWNLMCSDAACSDLENLSREWAFFM
jgi:hypothetical protein